MAKKSVGKQWKKKKERDQQFQHPQLLTKVFLHRDLFKKRIKSKYIEKAILKMPFNKQTISLYFQMILHKERYEARTTLL